MQRLQDQVLTLQVSNPFGLSATSRSRRLSLRPSSIAHLFQTSTIVLSNAMGLRSGHRLIWSFSGYSENSRPVIISFTRYGIAQLSTGLCSWLDSNLIRRGTPVYIVLGVSLASSSLSSLLPSSTCWCAFCWGFLGRLLHFLVAAEFLLIVIGRASCCLEYQFIFWFLTCYRMQYTNTTTRPFPPSAISFILSSSCSSESPTSEQSSDTGDVFRARWDGLAPILSALRCRLRDDFPAKPSCYIRH